MMALLEYFCHQPCVVWGLTFMKPSNSITTKHISQCYNIWCLLWVEHATYTRTHTHSLSDALEQRANAFSDINERDLILHEWGVFWICFGRWRHTPTVIVVVLSRLLCIRLHYNMSRGRQFIIELENYKYSPTWFPIKLNVLHELIH